MAFSASVRSGQSSSSTGSRTPSTVATFRSRALGAGRPTFALRAGALRDPPLDHGDLVGRHLLPARRHLAGLQPFDERALAGLAGHHDGAALAPDDGEALEAEVEPAGMLLGAAVAVEAVGAEDGADVLLERERFVGRGRAGGEEQQESGGWATGHGNVSLAGAAGRLLAYHFPPAAASATRATSVGPNPGAVIVRRGRGDSNGHDQATHPRV